MKNIFKFMPRVTIVPGVCEKDRIKDLVKYCREYRYDEVMFFLNAEDLNDGHIELSALEPYLQVILKAKQALEKEGVKTSLNPWNTLLGCERGRILKPGQNFATMVDIDGNHGAVTPCPLSEPWREYVLKYYLTMIERVRPEIIWIEDDFRMHNHSPLHWGGCFCEEHMKLYSRAAQKELTREELVRGMADGGEDNLYRKAYYSVTREVMNGLAKFLGSGIHSRYPEQKIGLMTSDPKMHSVEGRDWYGMLYALAGTQTPIDRIHLPCYRQCCAQDYCWGFNDVSMQTRALIPEETCVLPEIECAMFSNYTKSKNFVCFQAESCLSLCPQGVTLDLDCFSGNGIVAEYGYGEKLAKMKDYLSEFVKLNVSFSSMSGVVIPVREEAFLYAAQQKRLSDVRINENWWASHLASLGVSYRYSKEKHFKNQIVAVSGGYLNGLENEEIVELFQNNYVLLEGYSVEILFQKKLHRLIGAKSRVLLDGERGDYSFEEAAEGKTYLNIERARASALVTCPPFLNIEYDCAPENIYSYMYDYRGQKVGLCEVGTKKAFILPFMCETKHFGLLTNLRGEILKEYLRSLSLEKYGVIYNGSQYVSTYYYKQKDVDILLFVNFSDDGAKPLSVCGLKDYKRGFYLERESAKWRSLNLRADCEEVFFDCGVGAMQTLILKLEK